jgi:hypothetical protein
VQSQSSPQPQGQPQLSTSVGVVMVVVVSPVFFLLFVLVFMVVSWGPGSSAGDVIAALHLC